jgi:hypothetical protein
MTIRFYPPASYRIPPKMHAKKGWEITHPCNQNAFAGQTAKELLQPLLAAQVLPGNYLTHGEL